MKLEITNITLNALGAESITDVNNNEWGTIISQSYDTYLAIMLEEYTWSFCLNQKKLIKKNNKTQLEFKFEYAMPGDLLRISKINSSLNHNFNAYFKIINNSICSDTDNLYIEYVGNNIENSSANFKQALAFLLAYNLAPSLLNDSELTEYYLVQYQYYLNSALLSDSTQSGSIKKISYPGSSMWV